MEIDPFAQPDPLARLMSVHRTVLLGGPVSDQQAGEVAASLMALDALGDEPVELRVNARSDSLDAAFALIDTIDALGVYINATVMGSVAGTMVGVVAVCNRRRIGASARVELSEPRDRYRGNATEIERQAGALEARFGQYLHRLAEATGRPFEHLEADHRAGLILDARRAVAYGLVDGLLEAPSR